MNSNTVSVLDTKDSLLHQSWQAEAWMPILNPGNVLEYFAESIFYDRQCNNEIIHMQRANPDQLLGMVGTEYVLLIAQEPILYVIRKQHRASPTQVIPLAHYYVIAGKVYQAPDLGSVINARLVNSANFLQKAFTEVHSYAKYQSSKGYYWEFKDTESQALEVAKEEKIKGEHLKRKEKKKKEEPSSLFQRHKVDRLLDELTKKFPLKPQNPPNFALSLSHGAAAPSASSEAAVEPKEELKPLLKQEKTLVSNEDGGTSEPVHCGAGAVVATSVSAGGGNKRVAQTENKVKTEVLIGSDPSKPPSEKKIKTEKK